MIAALCLLALSSDLSDSDWPTWRGPDQDGRAVAGGDYVTEWSVDPATNKKWSAELPGRGASTPVVFTAADGSKRIAVTAAIDGRNGVVVLDEDGNQLWATPSGPLDAGKHKKASGANPSVAVGTEHLFAYFKSGELVAFTPEGEIAWNRNLAEEFGGYDKDALWWDLGTSPIVHGDTVIVAVMQSGPSFLVAIDQSTGDVTWKTDRLTDAPKEAAQSYTTPVLGTWGNQRVIFTAGADTLTCHAADGGAELWRVGGMNPEQDGYFRSISSPVLIDGPDASSETDYLLVPYARGSTIRGFAIEEGSDVTAPTEPLWVRDDLGSDVPTPTGAGGIAYVIADKGKDSGLITAIDVTNGQTVGTAKLPRAKPGYSSSPVLAGDRLYLQREDGMGFVVDVSDPAAMAVVGVTTLNAKRGESDAVVATPVLADGNVLIRTATMLHCFGK